MISPAQNHNENSILCLACDQNLADQPDVRLKAAQIVAVFVGSLTLMIGADFGADYVLPTLIPGGMINPVALFLALGTLLLCAFSVANAAGKKDLLPENEDEDGLEGQSRLVVLTAMLAVPGLGGAFLAGSGTAAMLGGGFLGALLGLGVGLVALLCIALTAWMAADPDPILAQLVRLPRRSPQG